MKRKTLEVLAVPSDGTIQARRPGKLFIGLWWPAVAVQRVRRLAAAKRLSVTRYLLEELGVR